MCSSKPSQYHDHLLELDGGSTETPSIIPGANTTLRSIHESVFRVWERLVQPIEDENV